MHEEFKVHSPAVTVVNDGFGLRRLAALACALSLVTACGGSGGDAGDGGGGTGGTNGSGTIGASGGTVSLPSGPSVVVPAGALPGNTTITVAASIAAAPAGAVSALYQFGPEGTTFTTPVTVSFPVPAGTTASDVSIYWTKKGSTTEWDVLPATVSGTTATAIVSHFSAGFVGAACTVGTACMPANACHTGVTTCNGTPACADSGANVADGATCGGGNVCTAGVCGAAQCIDMAGSWTITTHCEPNYVNRSVLIAQSGCTISTNEPVTGVSQSGQVVGNNIVIAGCQGSVTGSTWNMTCGTCNVTLARQAQCTAGLTCTPTGTADPCKTYATACDSQGNQTCVAGDKADGTSCGTGLTCTAGACGPSGVTDYVPVNVSKRYLFTPSGSATYTQSDEATQDTPPTWTRTIASSNATTYQVRSFGRSGGATFISGIVTYQANGTVASTASYDPPQMLFPADTTPGATSSSTSTVTVTGTPPYTTTRTLTVNGLESVTVPAGTFTALKVTTFITNSNGPSSYYVTWWVQGVSLVKTVTYPASNPSLTTVQEMTGYSQMACSGGVCACNALVNSAPQISPVYVPANLPTPTGGSIVDGTYYLTGNSVFSGPGGTSGPTGDLVKNTYLLQGGVMNAVTWHNGIAGDGVRSNFSFHVSGNQLVASTTCGATEAGSVGFTSTGNTIRIISPNASYPASSLDQGAEATLTRQ